MKNGSMKLRRETDGNVILVEEVAGTDSRVYGWTVATTDKNGRLMYLVSYSCSRNDDEYEQFNKHYHSIGYR